MNKYDKYKDSGFDWIGEIPEHWEVKKLKYLAFVNPSNIDKKSKKEEQEVFLCNYVDVYKNDFIRNGMKFMKATASDSQVEKFILEKGDVIATKDSETPNDIGVPAFVVEDFDNVVCGYHLTHIKPIEINGEFLFRFFQTQYLKSYFEISANGVTRYGLGMDKFNSAFILNPPLKEQTTIANYLDQKTDNIDELISKKEQQLKLYEKEKVAIINQAVTKGINTDVKLKNSGIDYIGNIPEQWHLKKLRYLGNCSNGISKSGEYFGFGFPFVSYGDVYKNLILPNYVVGLVNSSDDDKINYSVIKGDVFFTRTSETIEEIGMVSTCLNTIEDAVFAGFLIRFRPFGDKLFDGFSKYYFSAQIHRRFFVKEMNLVTRASLSQELLKRLPVALPPIKEQIEIAEYLDKYILGVDLKAEKTKKLIKLLKEYKQSLISEVVTGKIKITN